MADSGKERFLRLYANLPLSLRREIIAVIDKEPVSWEVAYREINGDTPVGKKIIGQLISLEVI